MDNDYKKINPKLFDEQHQHLQHHIQAPSTLLPTLMQRLHDKERSIHSFHDLQSLLTALDDENDAVRAWAIRELAQQPEFVADLPVARLLAALSDSSWLVREAALFTLDALSIGVSQEQQLMTLLDENEFVREAARLVFPHTNAQQGRHHTHRQRTRSISSHTHALRSHIVHLARSIDSLFLALYLTNRKGLLMAGHSPHTDDNQTNRTYLEEITFQQQKRRRRTLGIAGAALAVVVILGLAFSWFTVLHTMPHTTTAQKDTLDSPVLSDINQYTDPQLNWIDSKYVITSDPYNSAYATTWNVATRTQQQVSLFDAIATQPFHDSDYTWSSDGRYVVIHDVAPDTTPTTTSQPTSYTLLIEVRSTITGQKIIATSYHQHVAAAPVSSNDTNAPYPPTAILSPDNTRIAIASTDGNLAVWSLSTGKLIASYRIDGSPIGSIQWSSDSTYLLAQSENGLVGVWNTTTGKESTSFMPPSSPRVLTTSSGQTVRNLPITPALSPDGMFMAGVVQDKTIEVWSVMTHNVSARYTAANVGYVSWLSDSKELVLYLTQDATHDTVKSLQVWNADTQQVVYSVNVPPGQKMMNGSYGVNYEFSPSQKYLSLESETQQDVTIVNASTGQYLLTLHTHTTLDQTNNYGQALFWSPDERFVAAISRDTGKSAVNNVIQVWNASTGKLLVQYHSRSKQVLHVAWSPDGKYLASVSDGDLGNVMEVWRAPS